MSAVTTDTTSEKIATGKARQARIVGAVLIALALLVLFVLDVGAGQVATFKLSAGGRGEGRTGQFHPR